MPNCTEIVDAKAAFHGIPDIEVTSSLPSWISLRIAPKLHLKRSVVDFFRLRMSDLSTEVCDELCLAIDELLGNAIEHGCKLGPKSRCELTFIRMSRMILVQLRDSGFGFEWNAINHAAVNNPPEDPLRHLQLRLEREMRPGGYGIMLVKQVADELMYNERGNQVVFVKYL